MSLSPLPHTQASGVGGFGAPWRWRPARTLSVDGQSRNVRVFNDGQHRVEGGSITVGEHDVVAPAVAQPVGRAARSPFATAVRSPSWSTA
jgi:hypothetical protein